MVSKIKDYAKIASDLQKSYDDLSDFEALSLAIQIQRNEILENGLVVDRNDNNPAGLEAIARVIAGKEL